MVTRPVMASMASAIRLNWRIVVIVTSGKRHSKSGTISTIGFCSSSVVVVCDTQRYYKSLIRSTSFLAKVLAMRTLFVQLARLIQIRHIRDQIERFFVRRLPDRQDADRAVLLGGHPGRAHRDHFALHRPQIGHMEADAAGADQNIGCGTADIVPPAAAPIGLQRRASKL